MLECVISVVIPIYNTELYLDETIESIFRQSLGIEKIQVVLVNDASTDTSDAICQKYVRKYPYNFEYIELEKNSGVSHARNVGMQYARGKYITFLDSDDMWSDNAFEHAVDFLEANSEQIDMVSANVESFGKFQGGHSLNIDICEDKIVDVEQDYSMMRINGPACIVKTEIAKMYPFDEEQKHWEDAKFVNRVILRKQKYGMLAGVNYFYRRRGDGGSATQMCTKRKGYYLNDLEKLFMGICDESMKQCGKIIPMVQFVLAYTVGCYFGEKVYVLEAEELEQHYELLRKMLQVIDDGYLVEIPNADNITKARMVMFKHNIDFSQGIAEWEKDKQNLRQMSGRKAVTDRKFAVLKKWFEIQKQGRNLAPYFKQKGYKNVAIYGMAELGEYLYDELENAGIHVCYGIDRRAEKLDFQIPIMKPEDELIEVDAVIVTAVAFMEAITESLSKKVNAPIISIEDVLNSLL